MKVRYDKGPVPLLLVIIYVILGVIYDQLIQPF